MRPRSRSNSPEISKLWPSARRGKPGQRIQWEKLRRQMMPSDPPESKSAEVPEQAAPLKHGAS